MAVRPCSRCSERSSTAWIAYSPFAEIRTRSAHTFDLTGSLRHGSAHTAALEDARGLAGEVGDHDVGARPADGRERLHHGALLVEPAETPRGADHRVLARDRVAGQREAELGLRARDDVEVRQGRLDHHDVGALVQVEGDLAHGLGGVRRIHLVRATVAELRRGVGGVPEGAVEARRVLRRGGHDRRVGEARLAGRPPGRPAPAGHHVRGRDHVRARLGVRDRDAGQKLERRVIAHGAALDHAAVPVARVLAETHVGRDQEVGHHVLHRPHRLLYDAVVGVRLRAAWILLDWQAEQEHAGDPHAGDVLHVLHHLVDREAELAGHRADRLAHAAAVDDEERVDEVVDRPRGLANQLAQERLLAKTSGTGHRMCHHTLLLGRRPAFQAAPAEESASARASAGIVYSLGMTSVARPSSAAVAAVIGPMEATVMRPRQALRSSSLNCSAKFRAVDELVNVTASTAPEASASRRRTTPSSIRRVWYAGTSVTAAPSRRSSTTSTSRVSFARGSSTRSPGATTARSRSTSASARYSDGTISGRTPCSASASAVAGPIAATRLRAIAVHAVDRAARRRSTMATPFTLVKITHANDSSAASAVSSGSHDA